MNNNPHSLTVGDRVTYDDVNLLADKGTISEISPQPQGGDCLVKWDRLPFAQCIEVMRCLRKTGERRDPKAEYQP
jgi:hypothetical protein